MSADRGIIGMVAVPLEPPPLSLTLRNFGPTFAAIAIALLVAGTAVAALVIFGPSQTAAALAAAERRARSAPASSTCARRKPAATKSRRWHARSTRWPTGSKSVRVRSPPRTRRASSCSLTCRTS